MAQKGRPHREWQHQKAQCFQAAEVPSSGGAFLVFSLTCKEEPALAGKSRSTGPASGLTSSPCREVLSNANGSWSEF